MFIYSGASVDANTQPWDGMHCCCRETVYDRGMGAAIPAKTSVFDARPGQA